MNQNQRFRWAIGFLTLFAGIVPLEAQRAFCVMDHGGRMQIVKNVSAQHLYYGIDGNHSLRMDRASTALLDYPRTVPGLIHVERRDLVVNRTSVIGSQMHDTAGVDISVRIRPDRAFDDLFMVVTWYRNDGEVFYLACPIGAVQAGVRKDLEYSLQVPMTFRGTRYQLAFFNRGIEVESSLSGMSERSPMHAYLKRVRPELLVDGPPKPLVAVSPVAEWEDKATDPQRVVLKVKVDANGYVTQAEVVEPASAMHNAHALDAIWFWEFKAAIQNGQAVPSTLRIPLVF